MKKGCWIGIVAGLAAFCLFVAAVVGVIVFVFGVTSGAVDDANRFLAVVGEGKTQEAYQSAAAALRAAQSETEFGEQVKRLGLAGFQSASWSSRSIENDVATLEGTVSTASGGRNQLTVKLIKEGDQWKVLSLAGTTVGAVATPGGAATKQVPQDEQLQRLVRQTLLDFDAAVKEDDFTAFFGTISRLWQQQITAAKLREVFQPFVAQKADLSFVATAQAVFDQPPAIDGDGVLVLSGYYPAEPLRPVFQLKYVYEHPGWKLFGVQVRLVPSGLSVPSERELHQMATQALLDFNQALQDKDFSAFHAGISATWARQTTVEELRDVFQSFIDQKVDIAGIRDVAPILTESPAIDQDGTLVVDGYFPTQPLRVTFHLTYVNEQEQWRLLGIAVKLRKPSAPGSEE